MYLSAIVAMSENRAIGRDNKLLWHLPADLQYFKKTTMGKPVLMGRKTYQSIGRALPGRTNIVITRDAAFAAPGCIVAESIETALDALSFSEEVFIIGGAQLFEQLLPRTERLYLTLVHHYFDGDTFFPELNNKEWRELERTDHAADEKNPYAYSFIVLERIMK